MIIAYAIYIAFNFLRMKDPKIELPIIIGETKRLWRYARWVLLAFVLSVVFGVGCNACVAGYEVGGVESWAASAREWSAFLDLLFWLIAIVI